LRLEALLAGTHTNLRGIGVQIVEEVAANLERKVAGDWAESDDTLFEPLAAYAPLAWKLQWHWRAIRVWLVELARIIREQEPRVRHPGRLK
jgi:hypothetical protein